MKQKNEEGECKHLSVFLENMCGEECAISIGCSRAFSTRKTRPREFLCIYECVCGLLEGARTPSPSKIEYNDAFHLPGPIKPLSTKTVTGQTKYQIVTGLNCFLNLMSCSHTLF